MKKEKIKDFVKKYLIGFILGVLSAAVVVVYAETYFPSNQVTYDNTESGLSSTNVQTAIDELYNTCFPKTSGDQIIENAGLEKDEYECRYFFTGGNPNNYITFNNETAGWRIVNNMSTQVSNENSKTWKGNIALPTLSEYIRTNSNKSSCGTLSLNDANYSRCVSTGWMDTTSVSYWWTLSPISGGSNFVFTVESDGNVNRDTAYATGHAVRPALYLSSEVQITGGTGTQNDPFTLE